MIEIVNLTLILILGINRQPSWEGCRIEGKVSLLVDQLFLTAIKLSKGLNTAADVLLSVPFLCFLSLFLVAFSLLRHQFGLITSRPQFRPKFCSDCVVVREGSTKLHRPIVRMVKHGGLYLATSVERLILLRCGNILPNPRPHKKSLCCFMQNVRSLKAFQVAKGSCFESKLGGVYKISFMD